MSSPIALCYAGRMAAVTLSDQYRVLARYNTWMNERLYGLAATLPDAERKRDLGAFFKSIHGTLNHVLLGDRAWMRRFTGDAERFTSRDGHGEAIAVASLATELYADFEVLRRERAATDRDIEGWADGLDDATLAAPLAYKNSSGAAFEHPLWFAVGHLFNHQTHHRGQVTTLLMQLGHDPGVTDLAVFQRS